MCDGNGAFDNRQTELLSLLVGQCKEELKMLGKLSLITIKWVPTQKYRNECADELDSTESTLAIYNAEHA